MKNTVVIILLRHLRRFQYVYASCLLQHDFLAHCVGQQSMVVQATCDLTVVCVTHTNRLLQISRSANLVAQFQQDHLAKQIFCLGDLGFSDNSVMLMLSVLSYTSYVFSTIGASLYFHFGDDSVMVMACVLNKISRVFSNSKSLNVCLTLRLAWLLLSLALVFQHFTCMLLLTIYRIKDA